MKSMQNFLLFSSLIIAKEKKSLLKTDKVVCKRIAKIVIGKKAIKKTVGSMVN